LKTLKRGGSLISCSVDWEVNGRGCAAATAGITEILTWLIFLNSFRASDLQFTDQIIQASAVEADEQHRPVNHRSLFPIAARCHAQPQMCSPFLFVRKVEASEGEGIIVQ
jgi:hypothetical protein